MQLQVDTLQSAIRALETSATTDQNSILAPPVELNSVVASSTAVP